MLPAKKAPKKATKKAAAKHGHHHDAGKDDTGKDMRRAYEHLGRVRVLRSLLAKGSTKDIDDLTILAEKELKSGHMKDAADLLRAAEHLSFGALDTSEADKNIHPKLVDAITHEFDRKLEKAEEHWSAKDEHHGTIAGMYAKTTQLARKAFEAGAYCEALELARGAEALAHVKVHDGKQLGGVTERHQLNA